MANKLPGFGADPNTITISGFSGGAFAADQLKVIYSETFKGAGLLAGGPYYNMNFYGLDDELGSADVMATQSIESAEKVEAEGGIDPLSTLTD